MVETHGENGALDHSPNAAPDADSMGVSDYQKFLEESAQRLHKKENRGGSRHQQVKKKIETARVGSVGAGPETVSGPAAPVFSPPKVDDSMAEEFGRFAAVPFKMRAAKLKCPEYELTHDEQKKIGGCIDQLVKMYIPDLATKNPKLFLALSIVVEIGGTVMAKEALAKELKSQKSEPRAQPSVDPNSEGAGEVETPEPAAQQPPSRSFNSFDWSKHAAAGRI